jgi:arginine decarboxylase
MMIKTPTKFFFVKGSSEGYMPLNAFDGALMKAGVGNTNLLKMSSIIPPHCQEIEPLPLPQGTLVPVAYASITSQNPGEVISAAVAAAFPENRDHAALIMEYAAKGSKEEVETTVINMAEEGMKMRGKRIKSIKSVTVEHKVEHCGAAFAAVVLWD